MRAKKVNTRSGAVRYAQVMTEGEYSSSADEGGGACVMCGSPAEDYVEPDARQYHCDCCGQDGVYGLEELLIMGYIQLIEGKE